MENKIITQISLDAILQCGIVIVDMIFVESSLFTKDVYNYLSEDEYKDLQSRLVVQPRLGNVITGCGGIRKARWGQKGKSRGKRGGVRVYYFYIEELSYIHLLAIFGKVEKEDLTKEEKGILKNLAIQLKKSAKTRRTS